MSVVHVRHAATAVVLAVALAAPLRIVLLAEAAGSGCGWRGEVLDGQARDARRHLGQPAPHEEGPADDHARPPAARLVR